MKRHLMGMESDYYCSTVSILMYLLKRTSLDINQNLFFYAINLLCLSYVTLFYFTIGYNVFKGSQLGAFCPLAIVYCYLGHKLRFLNPRLTKGGCCNPLLTVFTEFWRPFWNSDGLLGIFFLPKNVTLSHTII